MGSQPQQPVDQLQPLVNQLLIHAGKAVKAATHEQALQPAGAMVKFRSKYEAIDEEFQRALDQIEIQILTAKAVFIRDAALVKSGVALSIPPPQQPVQPTTTGASTVLPAGGGGIQLPIHQSLAQAEPPPPSGPMDLDPPDPPMLSAAHDLVASAPAASNSNTQSTITISSVPLTPASQPASQLPASGSQAPIPDMGMGIYMPKLNINMNTSPNPANLPSTPTVPNIPLTGNSLAGPPASKSTPKTGRGGASAGSMRGRGGGAGRGRKNNLTLDLTSVSPRGGKARQPVSTQPQPTVVDLTSPPASASIKPAAKKVARGGARGKKAMTVAAASATSAVTTTSAPTSATAATSNIASIAAPSHIATQQRPLTNSNTPAASTTIHNVPFTNFGFSSMGLGSQPQLSQQTLSQPLPPPPPPPPPAVPQRAPVPVMVPSGVAQPTVQMTPTPTPTSTPASTAATGAAVGATGGSGSSGTISNHNGIGRGINANINLGAASMNAAIGLGHHHRSMNPAATSATSSPAGLPPGVQLPPTHPHHPQQQQQQGATATSAVVGAQNRVFVPQPPQQQQQSQQPQRTPAMRGGGRGGRGGRGRGVAFFAAGSGGSVGPGPQ